MPGQYQAEAEVSGAEALARRLGLLDFDHIVNALLAAHKECHGPTKAAFMSLAPVADRDDNAMFRRKDGTLVPKVRYRDSFRNKTRKYTDGLGVFSVLGPQFNARHSHLIEDGTTNRWRHRDPRSAAQTEATKRNDYILGYGIGGKFRWMMEGFVTGIQLRTGTMPAFHVLERAVSATKTQIVNEITESLKRYVARSLQP